MEEMIPTSDLKLTLDAPYHQCKYTPYYSLYISLGADKENLINNLELLSMVIISYILMTLLFDSELIL